MKVPPIGHPRIDGQWLQFAIGHTSASLRSFRTLKAKWCWAKGKAVMEQVKSIAQLGRMFSWCNEESKLNPIQALGHVPAGI